MILTRHKEVRGKLRSLYKCTAEQGVAGIVQTKTETFLSVTKERMSYFLTGDGIQKNHKLMLIPSEENVQNKDFKIKIVENDDQTEIGSHRTFVVF